MKNIKLAVTAGDPAGIGYEIACKYFAENEDNCINTALIGHRWIVEKTYREILKTNIPYQLTIIEPNTEKFDYKYGEHNADCGKAAMQYIEMGVKLSLEKKIEGIITCPINKKSIQLAGYNFPGHTEYLSYLSGGSQVSMMLAGKHLKTILATTHYPISQVASKITKEIVYIAIKNTHNAGRYFGNTKPKIAVCGLNPHAGDAGALGFEENIIQEAIIAAQQEDINVYGPYPADSLYASHKNWDFIIAMYHDQGMIPVKMDSFGEAVNVTLNLPFIRTSVDHGTAFDIAGKGIAKYSSLKTAINLGKKMVEYDKSIRSI